MKWKKRERRWRERGSRFGNGEERRRRKRVEMGKKRGVGAGGGEKWKKEVEKDEIRI